MSIADNTKFEMTEERGRFVVWKDVVGPGGYTRQVVYTIQSERDVFIISMEYQGRYIRVAQIMLSPNLTIRIEGTANEAPGLADVFRGALDSRYKRCDVAGTLFEWKEGTGKTKLHMSYPIPQHPFYEWTPVVSARWTQPATVTHWGQTIYYAQHEPVLIEASNTLTPGMQIAAIAAIWLRVYGRRML